jgi:RES domain
MATSAPKRVVAPGPPARLGEIALPLADVPDTWFRLSLRRYSSPLFWSRLGRYRFDSKDARWGVCYAAGSILSAFQEVFGNKIRHRASLDWNEVWDVRVWRITTPSSFRGMHLYGETLTVIDATLQCFVSSHPKSQRWGAALMEHTADLDGLVYIGRRCGTPCLAMFGDKNSPRQYQNELRTEMLGELQVWDEFWPMLDRLGVRLISMPKEREKIREWTGEEAKKGKKDEDEHENEDEHDR